jgi:hypothetical protein
MVVYFGIIRNSKDYRTYAQNTKNKGCGEVKGEGEKGKINPLTLNP